MSAKNNRKLLKICSMIFALLMILLTSGCGSNAGPDTEKKYEVDGVIFENDLISIAGVSTDEYLEVYKTQTITFKYFSEDFSELDFVSVINLGGSVLRVTPGGTYLDELPSSTLEVIEDGESTVITDALEEFYICQDNNGNITMYYEIYNLYDEEEQGNTIKKYLNLKAYKVEFSHYVGEPELEMI